MCSWTMKFGSTIFIIISGPQYLGGGSTPIHEGSRELPSNLPTFLTFSDSEGSSLYGLTWSHCPPISPKANSLSLSHLVPKIIEPKVGLIFCRNLYFIVLMHFITNFSLILVPFLLLFLTPHFDKTLNPIGSIFSSHTGPNTKNMVNYHPPPTHLGPIIIISFIRTCIKNTYIPIGKKRRENKCFLKNG